MSELLKIKQVDQLTETLALKALDADVVKKANNLSDVNATSARTNLNLYSKTEVDSLIMGAKNAYNVADNTAKAALTGLKVTDRVFVNDDGDTKWALYIVTAVTTGAGSTSTFKKIADEDLFTNALSASAVKASYESNADTYAFSGLYKGKLDKITIATNIDLDSVKSNASTALANAATAQNSANTANTAAGTAQTSANNANAAAAAAQTTANNAATAAAAAQTTANGKEDSFSELNESFTSITGAANTDIQLNLAQTVKTGFVVHVYFNGLKVKNVVSTVGSNSITYRVPYTTEASDTLIVTYCH
jgi:hypothetical protein